MGKVHLSEIISSVELYRFNIGEGYVVSGKSTLYLSEIISSVELYRFNIGGGLCSEWEHLSEIISSVELYCFNIGEGLCSEWEKYISVKLYLVLSYTILI